MGISEYKDSIKEIIDSTDNEVLLRTWKKQLERDLDSLKENELSGEECNPVQEGLADYENSDIITNQIAQECDATKAK